MKDSHLYINLWKKYLPVFRILISNSKTSVQTLPLSKLEFQQVGSRDKAGFQFNLEIERGKVSNDISGSAVARDLFKVLSEDLRTKGMIQKANYKLNLDSRFVLNINKLD